MGNFETAISILDYSQDYNSRIIILSLILIFNLFIYFFSYRFKDEEDWQLLRNWFLKILSISILIMWFLFMPVMLSKGSTLELVLDYIINFYKIGFLATSLIIYVWMFDKVNNIISSILNRGNTRRNYLFNKRGRK